MWIIRNGVCSLCLRWLCPAALVHDISFCRTFWVRWRAISSLVRTCISHNCVCVGWRYLHSGYGKGRTVDGSGGTHVHRIRLFWWTRNVVDVRVWIRAYYPHCVVHHFVHSVNITQSNWEPFILMIRLGPMGMGCGDAVAVCGPADRYQPTIVQIKKQTASRQFITSIAMLYVCLYVSAIEI